MKKTLIYSFVFMLVLPFCKKTEEEANNQVSGTETKSNFTLAAYNYLEMQEYIMVYFYLDGYPDELPEVTIDGEKMDITLLDGVQGSLITEPTNKLNYTIKHYGKTHTGTIEIPTEIANVRLNEIDLPRLSAVQGYEFVIPDNFTIKWDDVQGEYVKYEFNVREKDAETGESVSKDYLGYKEFFEYSLLNPGYFISRIGGMIEAYKGVDLSVSNPTANVETEIGKGYVYGCFYQRILIIDYITSSKTVDMELVNQDVFNQIKERTRRIED